MRGKAISEDQRVCTGVSERMYALNKSRGPLVTSTSTSTSTIAVRICAEGLISAVLSALRSDFGD
ncbi:uncharacterized protein GWK60_H08723 [Nakaseomyces glabratus]|nr:hypothetical protein J6894_02443 [Nakaseomyces glabratus]QNG14524.1 uncharacterized protein GWK60_H08723 [Nakaseomyces glabratus]